jgi:aryl-alcohol dehydrogenase-like predicted oxidoreductase
MAKEKKEKEVVVDEVWTETRVREFLDVKPAEAIEADFHMLQKAYQQMRADDFEKFVAMFLQENRNINARDPHGRTLLSYMREHTKSSEYVDIMLRNGAL